MKMKKFAKQLLAVGTGATMLGATVVGAMASDLSDYPGGLFVENGQYDGYFVVGEGAKSIDNLAVVDIATGMKVVVPGSAKAAKTTTTVEGDAWLVAAGSDELEIGEGIGPASTGVVDFIDSDDLQILADGELRSSKGTFEYEQFLHFNNANLAVNYTEDDDDVTDLFLWAKDNTLVARYELDFLEAAESDIDASDSYKLDDFEGKSLKMLGKNYDIVKAVTGGANSNQVTLTFMAGSVRDQLDEGESQTYNIDGKDYEVELTYTSNTERAQFVINGQSTGELDEGETFTLDDGTVLGLSTVLHQDYAGGVHNAEFFIGADKIEMQDDNIAVAGSTDELKVNEENIDGANVIISGTVIDNATSSTDDGELEIDFININMTAEDDYYIAKGETLLGQAELEEKDFVFTQNWDLRFEGMDATTTHEISVKDKSGEKEYELSFTNIRGDKIQLPIAYATGSSSVRPGDQDDVLRLNNSNIADEEYFILNDDSNEDSVTSVVQYKGANVGSEQTTVKFKILGSGETIERSFDTGTNTSTLKLAGTTFTVTCHENGPSANATSTFSNDCGTDDFNITVTGGTATNANTATESSNFLIAQGGAKIFLRDVISTAETDHLQWNVSLIDDDRADDYIGTLSANAPYLLVAKNISVSSTELDFTDPAGSALGVALVSPDDNDDETLGYGSNGAFIRLVSPSGSNTADTITIDMPEELSSPQVYVTGGEVQATTVSGGAKKAVAGGVLESVQVVDATRLDSEISDVKANNLIVVGGPCANTVASSLLGDPADCTEGFKPGVARVKLWQHDNGKYAMLVAGFSGEDTRLAGRVIAHRADELSGMEVEITGTTYGDAKISAPTKVDVAMEKEGDAMEK